MIILTKKQWLRWQSRSCNWKAGSSNPSWNRCILGSHLPENKRDRKVINWWWLDLCRLATLFPSVYLRTSLEAAHKYSLEWMNEEVSSVWDTMWLCWAHSGEIPLLSFKVGVYIGNVWTINKIYLQMSSSKVYITTTYVIMKKKENMYL